MSLILGPNGIPISAVEGAGGRAMVDIGPGVGGRIVARDTMIVLVDGNPVRFAPGAYLVIFEDDFERMRGAAVAAPPPGPN